MKSFDVDGMLREVSIKAEEIAEFNTYTHDLLVRLDAMTSRLCYKLGTTPNLEPIERIVLARSIMENCDKRNKLVAHIQEKNNV